MSVPSEVFNQVTEHRFYNNGAELRTGSKVYTLCKRGKAQATVSLNCVASQFPKLKKEGYIVIPNANPAPLAYKRIQFHEIPKSQKSEWLVWDEQ